ncbi:MAG: glycosyltransferase, partial [Actinomycetota bacterium]
MALHQADVSLTAADLLALAAAAVVAYLLNRVITFRGDPEARWVSNPGLFATTAVVAGAVDLGVLTLFDRIGLAVLAAKLVAVGAAAVVRWTAYRWILFRWVRRDLAERLDRPPAPGDLRVSVVVPAYNEAERIGATIDAIDRELATTIEPGDYEIVVVDDGSTDATVERATEAGARVLAQPANRGKGASVRAGVLAARGRAVLFTDADLAYPPPMLLRILGEVEEGWDMVVGSRRHQETATLANRPRIRELGGSVVNRLTHLVLLGHFRDTQCGLKGFRGDVGARR